MIVTLNLHYWMLPAAVTVISLIVAHFSSKNYMEAGWNFMGAIFLSGLFWFFYWLGTKG